MQYNFIEWVKQKELNEVRFAINLSHDNFSSIDQKAGDFVYFGVHDIGRFYRENQYLPSQLDIETVVEKSGRIEDADPVNQTVTVLTSRDPFHYGYRKLEDPKSKAKRLKGRSGEIKINIPIAHLQDVTYMIDPKASFAGQRLWLVVDGKTPFQTQIMLAIRKKEHERKKQIDQAAQQIPGNYDVDPQKVAAAKDWLTGKGAEAEVETPSMSSIFPNEPQTIQTNQHAMNVRNRLRARRGLGPFSSGLDVACVNPYDNLWKMHDDTEFYEYYTC